MCKIDIGLSMEKSKISSNPISLRDQMSSATDRNVRVRNMLWEMIESEAHTRINVYRRILRLIKGWSLPERSEDEMEVLQTGRSDHTGNWKVKSAYQGGTLGCCSVIMRGSLPLYFASLHTVYLKLLLTYKFFINVISQLVQIHYISICYNKS